MGIFKKNTPKEAPKSTLTQKEWTMEQLLAGRELSMLDMLVEYGIGHHAEVIRRCRVEFEKKGFGYDYIHTEMRKARSKVTGKEISFAVYSIPEIRKRKYGILH